jgi:hypothetical protein
MLLKKSLSTAVLIGERSLALFLSKKSREGISGLFQQYRSKRAVKTSAAAAAFADTQAVVEASRELFH